MLAVIITSGRCYECYDKVCIFISNNRQDKEYSAGGVSLGVSTVATVLLIHGACTSLGIRERLVARGARLARACARLREWAGEGRGGGDTPCGEWQGVPAPRSPSPRH